MMNLDDSQSGFPVSKYTYTASILYDVGQIIPDNGWVC